MERPSVRFQSNCEAAGKISSGEGSASDDEGGQKGVGSKSQRLWRRMKEQYQLVEFHALPEYLRDNEFILRHYRADWPLKHTLLSVFAIHNETLNIWTHLVGFLLFLCLTVYTAQKVPNVTEIPASWSNVSNLPEINSLQSGLRSSLSSLRSIASLRHHFHVPEQLSLCMSGQESAKNNTQQCLLKSVKQDMANMITPFFEKPVSRWPFYVFMGGAMACLLASSSCHLLSCHSARLSYFMWRVDYAGIAAMIATSFYPPVYYIFQCDPVWKNLYLTGITLLGFSTVSVSLVPSFQRPKYRKLRALLFVGMGGSGVIPAVHALISNWHEPICFTLLAYEIGMALFYISGVLIYVTRIPERWRPGLFDIAGHSHQIFHLLVIAGAYTHYQAGLMVLEWRDAKGCPP
ncbi:hypothetical protein O6H91_04G005100 [Diphasiastrum complanatum]|uniref:Uncharacterized protein n=2 Tax=Diphasiastrum complanatum TaxID=34168 RepID=A0ACC2DTW7_DIPCM|nr:hypothetical protein O6H91_04G004800 [Diphasiastrum complanatum]KAJ7557680.1 hypothetical protein O6H91_04G005100 [Diphasiastrum complanatum]